MKKTTEAKPTEAIQINTVSDLRTDLITIYGDLRAGKIGIREAKERTNVAGKILNSAKLQLEYNMWTKNGNKVKFLDCKN